jgi:ketosteroid isomerase-like protein
MSQENVDLVYRAADAFNRRDLDAALALMDDDVEVIPGAVAMEGGNHYHGHDGVGRWWRDLFDVFPDYAVEVFEVRDVGDMTVAATVLRGHGAGSNVSIEDMVWLVHRWRGGKCIWWRNFGSGDEALEAVGLWSSDVAGERGDSAQPAPGA